MTNEEVRNRIQNAMGVHDDLLTMVKKPHLKILWHDEDNSAGNSERPSINIFKHLPQNLLEPKHISSSSDKLLPVPGLGHPVISLY